MQESCTVESQLSPETPCFFRTGTVNCKWLLFALEFEYNLLLDFSLFSGSVLSSIFLSWNDVGMSLVVVLSSSFEMEMVFVVC